MRASQQNHLKRLLPILSVALLSATPALPALAAGGDIIISRQVQPRSAVRQELVADPSPQVVNPRREALLQRSLDGGLSTTELSDGDFAQVSSGSRFAHPLQGAGQAVQGPLSSGSTVGASGLNPAGHSGGAGRAGATVGRSIQQGLGPLRLLQAR